jgi:hypothetical protein
LNTTAIAILDAGVLSNYFFGLIFAKLPPARFALLLFWLPLWINPLELQRGQLSGVADMVISRKTLPLSLLIQDYQKLPQLHVAFSVDCWVAFPWRHHS